MNEYSRDALEITDRTDVEEVVEFTKRRIENPIVISDTTIYHFNTHKIDKEAITDAVENKLERDIYQIPLQVHSGSRLIQSILPQQIQEAELLIYREDQEEYYAYKNLIRDLPIESRSSIKQQLANTIRRQ